MNTDFITSYIDTDMAFTIRAHEMLHAEQRKDKVTKFEVGDKVKVVEEVSNHYGQVGTISREAEYYDWFVNFDGEFDLFHERHLELVEEEEEMTEKKKFFRGQSVIIEGGEEGIFLYDDGEGCNSAVVLIDGGREYHEYEYLEPSNKFTFAQVVQGLLEDYFEKGTEFNVEGNKFYAGYAFLNGYGLKETAESGRVTVEIGANLINATWELVVPEEPIKELTLDELEEILGHKVKIKNND